ncbi:P-loop NTPase family protein [Bacillus swezeyi]|uniref:Uncharacterized protein n=1 Tax=Bacillus swezeyi TaxID=1925020 RepID=A0A5M8RHQ0_9BACI|nr:hypothetical protein [Bacillus swezeyi]KAA6446910.1 hypothetical protein DX927_22930 [Bacillus swezeyi]KAA6471478.1 hypothetical protein DX928_23170 [Bacillus swezeyi]
MIDNVDLFRDIPFNTDVSVRYAQLLLSKNNTILLLGRVGSGKTILLNKLKKIYKLNSEKNTEIHNPVIIDQFEPLPASTEELFLSNQGAVIASQKSDLQGAIVDTAKRLKVDAALLSSQIKYFIVAIGAYEKGEVQKRSSGYFYEFLKN